MEQIILHLGLAADASQADVIKAIGQKQQESLSKAIDAVMQLGKAKNFINEANEATYRELAKKDFESVATLIGSAELAKTEEKPVEKKPVPAQLSVAELVAELKKQGGGNGKTADDRGAWTLADWQDKDEAGLLKMKESEPAKYAELAKAYYGNSVEV